MALSSDRGAVRTPNDPWFLSAVALLVVLVGWVYAPGLQGGFLFDDNPNILQNPKVLVDSLDWDALNQAMWSSESGRFRRPVTMLSFAVNHRISGTDPYWFKFTNLLIHFACGLGLYFLSQGLLAALGRWSADGVRWIALAVTAAWLLHPLNLTTVLYVVQRMTGLAAMFSIGSMVFYVWGRARQVAGVGGGGAFLALALLLVLLAVLSKENGFLTLPVLFLIEWMLLQFKTRTVLGRRSLQLFHVVFCGIPLLLVGAVLIWWPEQLLAGYAIREFDLVQRLMSEARAVFFYIGMTLVPDPALLGLYHDDFQVSTSLFAPPLTGLACAGILVMVVAVLLLRRRWPVAAFGLAFFGVGHAMESTILPLELVHEHRNYLPDYGLLLPLFVALLGPLFGGTGKRRWPRLLAASGLIALFAASTAVRAWTWSNSVDLILTTVRHHPASARANLDAGAIYFVLAERDAVNREQHYRRARQHYLVARSGVTEVAASLSLLMLDDRLAKPIDAVLVRDTADRLASPPLPLASINALLQLADCQFESKCGLPGPVVDVLYRAALDNPQLNALQRNQILTKRARRALAAGDLERALQLTSEAVAATPRHPQAYLNQAEVLAGLGRHREAGAQLAIARRCDLDRFYADRIDRQQRDLERMAAAAAAGAQ